MVRSVRADFVASILHFALASAKLGENEEVWTRTLEAIFNGIPGFALITCAGAFDYLDLDSGVENNGMIAVLMQNGRFMDRTSTDQSFLSNWKWTDLF